MTEPELPQIEDLRSLFLNDVPLLDVRAPVEFTEGAFPSAENHPLINDEERHEIGSTYAEQGQENAVALGEKLVSGARKKARIERWQDYLQRHPDAVLYCFRGGMRSQISQRWLHQHTGITCPRVRGGYKAMRRFLLDELTHNSALCRPLVIGGRTGVGKTRLLARYDAMIDLEGLAHHRGSAFGHHAEPQPSQIAFENAVSIALMKRIANGNGAFLIEDESRNIGSRHVPPVLYEKLQESPLVLLEASDEERVEITLQEYVHDTLAEFVALYGEQDGFERWAGYLHHSLDRIQRRLGGERFALAKDLLSSALQMHAGSGQVDQHRAWIALLLHEYYDGMYNYQLERKTSRIVFRGTADEIAAYLADNHAIKPSHND